MPSRFAEEGARRLGEEKLPDAVRAFSAGLEADPNDPDCLLGLAQARLRQGERGDAEDALHRLLAVVPGHGEAESHLAWLASTLGDEGAVARLEEIAARPGAGFAELMNLGAALFDRGDFAGAEAAFGRALALAPKSRAALFEVGRLRLHRGDAEGAWPLLAEAAKSGDPLAQGLLVRAHRARRQPVEAREAALAAQRSTPQLNAFAEALYEIALETRDLGEAVRQAEALRAMDPRSPRCAYLHGVALREAGDPDGADRAWQEALRLSDESGPPELRAQVMALLGRR